MPSPYCFPASVVTFRLVILLGQLFDGYGPAKISFAIVRHYFALSKSFRYLYSCRQGLRELKLSGLYFFLRHIELRLANSSAMRMMFIALSVVCEQRPLSTLLTVLHEQCAMLAICFMSPCRRLYVISARRLLGVSFLFIAYASVIPSGTFTHAPCSFLYSARTNSLLLVGW